jgi:cholesterol oxidase
MSYDYDFDWLVIGSGFGGSVSALRLAEKGYRVGVLEAGRRFADEDFAKSTWNLRRFLFAPALGLRGIMRIYLFKDISILAGAGVGGGSLVYANTLYQPGTAFFEAPEWSGLGDWERELAPHYAVARRMLGASRLPFRTQADDLIKLVGERMGVADTYRRPEVGVFFGPAARVEGTGSSEGLGRPESAGRTFPDPYFDGQGPARTACTLCGGCMIGCRYGAKNTLVKNYLWLAEQQHGVSVLPDRTVKDVRPLGAVDGSDGYAVTFVRSGAWGGWRTRETLRARGVVLAAGAVGTNLLLARARRTGALPRLSPRIGQQVRTNSEALLAVTARDDSFDFADSVAITSSIYPRPDTHIENVSYGHGGGFISVLFTLLTGEGSRLTRPLKLLAAVLRQPRDFMRLMLGRLNWSQRTMILLVMQTLPGQMSFRARGLGRRVLMSTHQDPEHPNPTFIAEGNRAAQILAEEIGGIAQSNVSEALFNVPATAHILGGAVIGASAETGVVDRWQRTFGYENLLICDGSVVPANPGVNPSLTITALAERAISAIPARSAPVAAEADLVVT